MRPRWVDYLPYLGGALAGLGFCGIIGLIVWLGMRSGKVLNVDDTAAGLHRFSQLLKPWMEGMIGAFIVLAVGLILIWASNADRRTRM